MAETKKAKKTATEEFKAVINGFELAVANPEIQIKNNVDALCEFIENRMKDYDVEKYQGNAELAKQDRVELNKGVTEVTNIRKSIKTLNPYAPIEEKLMSAEKLMKKGSELLGDIVHVKEEEERKAKKIRCLEIWNSKNFSVIPMDKAIEIFNPKWLNKTCKESDISNEMDGIINQIYKDLKTIETFGEDAETIKSCYLEDLNISNAFDMAEQLKKNRQIIQEERENREQREHDEAITVQLDELRKERAEQKERSEMDDLASMALGTEPMKVEIIKEWNLSFKATEKQLTELKQYLTDNEIVFDNLVEVTF